MSSSENQNIWIAIKHRQKFVCKYRKEIESILEHRFFVCIVVVFLIFLLLSS